MIFGIGTDIVQLERVAKVLNRYGDHFVRRVLMPEEEAAFRHYPRPVRFLAMRFAAKEAIVKALGTGFANGIWIRDVGILPNKWGKPEILWSDRGRALRDEMGVGDGHVSLTDEAGLIVAVVVLMRAQPAA